MGKVMAAAIMIWAAQIETRFTVEYGGKRYVSLVTGQDLQSTPVWPPGQENPPLPPRRAIEAASRYLVMLLPDGRDWRLYQVTLKPIGDRWIYLVEFLEPIAPDAAGRQASSGFSVVVLMNGRTVAPKIE